METSYHIGKIVKVENKTIGMIINKSKNINDLMVYISKSIKPLYNYKNEYDITKYPNDMWYVLLINNIYQIVPESKILKRLL